MIYLLTGTTAYRDLVYNAVLHLLKYVKTNDIIVCVPDENTKRIYETIPCNVTVSDCELPEDEQLYKSGAWGQIVHWKLSTVVQQLGYSDVLYIDPDVVVFADIRQHVPYGDWSICVQQNCTGRPCMGVVAAKSNEFTRNFLAPIGPIASDDAYINHKWCYADRRLEMFPRDRFPVGVDPLDRDTALCYHYNWIVGTEAKISRMVVDGNWIV